MTWFEEGLHLKHHDDRLPHATVTIPMPYIHQQIWCHSQHLKPRPARQLFISATRIQLAQPLPSSGKPSGPLLPVVADVTSYAMLYCSRWHRSSRTIWLMFNGLLTAPFSRNWSSTPSGGLSHSARVDYHLSAPLQLFPARYVELHD